MKTPEAIVGDMLESLFGIDCEAPASKEMESFIVFDDNPDAVQVKAGMGPDEFDALFHASSSARPDDKVERELQKAIDAICGKRRDCDFSPSDYSCSLGARACVVEDMLVEFPSQPSFSPKVPAGFRARTVRIAGLKKTALGERVLMHVKEHHKNLLLDTQPHWYDYDGELSRPQGWVVIEFGALSIMA